jgi:hypothetical protein
MTLKDGWQIDLDSGEEFFFIRNPALGLWAVKTRLDGISEDDGGGGDSKQEPISKRQKIDE